MKSTSGMFQKCLLLPSSGRLCLDVGAVSISETSVNFYETTLYSIPEDSHLLRNRI
jgi:hypothetical protein